ncbi:hypothetical protein HDV02_006593 [Globomyces sp. JEL0801]|nr:hypothetical protein HDV02_006593 [Globomyces sp. JEL0801]
MTDLRQFFPKADFYSILEVDKDASKGVINKAYRKVSLNYHPDKTSEPNAPKIYKTLTSIAAILKNQKSRALYDKHLRRGFPTWRGSGYHYNRFEPSIPFIFVLILVFVSVAQYITAWILYLRPAPERVAKAQDSDEEEDEDEPKVVLTATQIQKRLKRQMKDNVDGESPVLSKKDIKKGKYSLPEAKTVEVESPPIEIPVKEIPSLYNLAIVQVPVYLLRSITSFTKQDKGVKQE